MGGPSIAERLFASQVLADLQLPRSVIPDLEVPVVETAMRRVDTTENIHGAASLFLHALEKGFVAEMRRDWGATERHFPLRRINEERVAGGLPELPWLDGRGEDFVELSLDYQGYRNDPGTPDDLGRHLLTEAIFTSLDATMGGDLGLFTRSESILRIRLLPAGLLLGAAALIYGQEAMEMELFAGPCPLDEIVRLAEPDRRPIRISTTRWNLHGAEALHPYVGAVHDLFHLLKLSRLGRPFRQDLLKICRGFIALPPSLVADGISNRETYIESILDGPKLALSNSPARYRDIFSHIFYSFRSEEFQRAFYARLKQEFDADPRGPLILEAFTAAKTIVA